MQQPSYIDYRPGTTRRRSGWTAAAGICIALVLASTARADQSADYVIGAQDVLSITVFNQANLGGKYAVEFDGTFTFPLIGPVTAGGMTVRSVEAEIKSKLTDGFFNNPQVTVAIEQYRSQRIFIVGEVKNAGSFALAGDMTLIEALAKAGSTTQTAGDEIVVTRAGAAVPAGAPASSDVLRVNLKDLQSGAASARNIQLRDGDTIYVPRAELVYVFGEVKNPGSYALQSGASALQALSLAGGVTPNAATNRLAVVRVVNGAKIELRIRLTDPIQPGDTIVVPERFF